MPVKRLYLETSIINFVYADDAPEKRDKTNEMLDILSKDKNYKFYISNIVTEEIEKAPIDIANKLLEVIKKYGIEILPDMVEAEELGNVYIEEGLIPKKYEDDAYHIAIATVHNMHAIVSWNFKHIVKMKTIEGVRWINESKGYNAIDIYSPLEVI